MKKYALLLPALLFLASCSEAPSSEEVETTEVEAVVEGEEQVYPYAAGEPFDQSVAVSMDELTQIVKDFDGNRKQVAFTSMITENCEKKGCWMTVAAGEEDIRVSFKDYEFFVPLDSKGHQTTLNGELFYDTLTVDQLRHFAMDANASQDSIEKITEPIITLSYEATGVYVQ
jgi:hypothetical protein